MNTTKINLSNTRISRIREQGYHTQSDEEINALAFGNRFAYRLCTTILATGVLLSNIPILTAMMAVAFGGVVMPNHPFDYIYNYFLADSMQKPKLPPRSAQLKFACAMATLWIGTTIYLLSVGMTTAACVMGLSLLGVALLVSTIDFCIPSIIFNAIVKPEQKTF